MSAWSRPSRRTSGASSTSTSSSWWPPPWPCSRSWSSVGTARSSTSPPMGWLAALAGARRLPLVEGGAVGLHRVNLVPAGPPRGSTSTSSTPPSWPPSWGWGRSGRGWRRPPWMTTRTVEAVARRILAKAGGPALEISASGLIDAATVFRSVMPRTYHRLRRNLVGHPALLALRTWRIGFRVGRENCPGVANQRLRLGGRPKRTTCDGSILSEPARNGRAAVGGTTCISRSTTTSF